MLPCFLRGIGIHFGFQQAQGADDAGAGLARLDHVVQETMFGGDEGIGEALLELLCLGPADCLGVGGSRRVRGDKRC